MNRRYTANKKNGGVPPVCDDTRKLVIPVGCGHCIECKKQKAREWQVRLAEEIQQQKIAHFVTLTFSDEAFEKLDKEIQNDKTKNSWENKIASKAIRKFTEKWRDNEGRQPRRWLITELGHENTERMHIHGIIFEDADKIKDYWEWGIADTGQYVNQRTVNYVVKYVMKTDNDHPDFEPKIFCSKGIGKGYIDKRDARNNIYNGDDTDEQYKLPNGAKVALPIYYRNKIYSEEEKEALWIKRLDDETMYVMGNKIDISQGQEIAEKARERARIVSKRLGYKEDKSWSLEKYESRRIELLMNKTKKQIKENEEFSI